MNSQPFQFKGKPLSFLVILLSSLQFIQAQPFVEQTGISIPYETSLLTWGDYDNDGDLDILSSKNGIAYTNKGNNTFTPLNIFTPIHITESSAWGDYDNDGDLDVITTGFVSQNDPKTYIFRNNGNKTFNIQGEIAFIGVSNGSVAWGDYDNDDYLDILLTGKTSTGNYVSKIFHNNKDNTFTEQSAITLNGVYCGSVAWGDYDNDGDLDIVLTGSNPAGGSLHIGISKVYRNNGNNTFSEQAQISLPKVWYSSVKWFDYDNNGYLDILIVGNRISDPISAVFRNNGNNTFSQDISFIGLCSDYHPLDCGDYDNDGYLDLILTGSVGLGSFTKLYHNNGNSTFSVPSGISFPDVSGGSAKWGDYDNDGDLDLILTNNNNISKIYRNELISGTPPSSNLPPSAPLGLQFNEIGNKIILSWKHVKTDATPYRAMTYNLRVGKTIGGCEVVSPHSAANGYRRIIDMGNAQLDTSFILQNLPVGTYYWSVQAIDGGFKGGNFSEEGTFTVTNPSTAITTSHSLSGIKAYPNPVTNCLNIEGITEKTEIYIFTAGGKLVKTIDWKDKNIDLKDLSKGFYILKINNQKGNAEYKFLKQ